jgi:hypothetical protein
LPNVIKKQLFNEKYSETSIYGLLKISFLYVAGGAIFFIGIVGGWTSFGSTRYCGHQWSTVPALGDYNGGEIGGMISSGN